MDRHAWSLAVLSVLVGRQAWVAWSTFTIIDGPSLRRFVIPLSLFALFALTRTAQPTLWMFTAACLIAVSALALLEWARHSIRGQFFSCLFSNDVPQFLWTSGPYAYVRNPFYTSYLLAYLCALVLAPGAATLALLVAMFLYYSAAARKEERKFADSPLAAAYERYRGQVGRFVPRWHSS